MTRAVMGDHQFHVGQAVTYSAGYSGSARPRGVFHVVALVPERDGSPMYQVKGELEAYRRVVAEHELRPRGPDVGPDIGPDIGDERAFS